MDETDLLRGLDFNSGKLDRQMVDHVSGFSPLTRKRNHLFGLSYPGKINQSELFLTLLINKGKSLSTTNNTSQEGKDQFQYSPHSYRRRS